MRERWLSEVSRRAEPAMRDLARLGQWEELARLCHQVLEADPDSLPALEFLTRCAWHQFSFDQVCALSQRILALQPDDPMAWLWMGRATMVLGMGVLSHRAFVLARERAAQATLERLCDLNLAKLRESQAQWIQQLLLRDAAFRLEFEANPGSACSTRGLLYFEDSSS